MLGKPTPRFGAKKDTWDPRDKLHMPAVMFAALPPVVDMSMYRVPAMSQGSTNGCVGFALDANLSEWAKKLGVYAQIFSSMWIWNGARFIEGTLAQNAGVQPRDAFDWIIKKGLVLNDKWPFHGFDAMTPPSSLDPDAAKYPVAAYYRCVDGYQGIYSALAEGNFVSICIPWHPKWNYPWKGVLCELQVADGVPQEWHEVTLDSAELASGRFSGMNSWGGLWGNNGAFTMPFSAFDVFKAWGGYDAQYVAIKPNVWLQEPPPTPEPVIDNRCRLCKAFAALTAPSLTASPSRMPSRRAHPWRLPRHPRV